MAKTTPRELIRLIFGDQANSMASLVSERLTRWAEAFDTWLDEREHLKNRNMRRIAHCAWRDFLTFNKKAPWETDEADVLEWVEALVERGLRPSTINQRLTALTKFYLYCQEQGIDGGHVPDPAAHIPRLQERKYSKSLYLGEAELQALLAAIDSFDGTVVMVTHNEMFLKTLAERLIIFQNDEIFLFEGAYQRFLEKGGWKDEEDVLIADSGENKKENTRINLSKKEIRRRRSEVITERARILKPLEQRLHRTETHIEKHEKRLAELHAAMQKATQAGDGSRIAELSKSIHRCQGDIEKLYDELVKSSGVLEAQKAIFEEKLERKELL